MRPSHTRTRIRQTLTQILNIYRNRTNLTKSTSPSLGAAGVVPSKSTRTNKSSKTPRVVSMATSQIILHTSLLTLKGVLSYTPSGQ